MKTKDKFMITKVYLIPLILTMTIALILSFYLSYRTKKKYYEIYQQMMVSASKAHINQISSSKKTEALIISEFNKRLSLAIDYSIDNIEDLSDTKLRTIANNFDIKDIFFYDNNGKMLFDSTFALKNDYEMIEGDPIHKFMISNDIEFYEGIRPSLSNGVHNMYAYKKTPNGFFQASIAADKLYILTDEYAFEKVVVDIVSDQKEVVAVYIFSNNGHVESSIEDVNGMKFEVELKAYYDLIKGQDIVRERYSKSFKKTILEVTAPLRIDDSPDKIITFYFSLGQYTVISNAIVYVVTILSFIIIFAFSFFTLYFMILPLHRLETSLATFDPNVGSYIKPKKEYYIFSGAFESLSNISNSLFEINIMNDKLNDENYALATTDYLTHLPNRLLLIDHLEKFITKDKKFALIFMDLDNFKMFNDSKGHVYGDDLLKGVSTKLSIYNNEHSFVARYGGDEFIILLPYSNRKEITKVIDDIYTSLMDPVLINGEKNYIDLSVGISLFPKDGNTSIELIRKADLAMYNSKARSKNTYAFYNKTMDSNLEEENRIKDFIQTSLTDDGFKILLQPQVDIRTNEIISYEALARFKECDIGPKDFIKVAEKYNLLKLLGKIIITKVIKTFIMFKENNIPYKTIYVNFSIDQLKDPEILRFILNQLQYYDIPTEYFGIEITENVLIKNDDLSVDFFNKLIQYGFKVSIDDFGSGNASINYLINYPLGLVKLDRSFVNRHLTINNLDVFKSIVDLAETLNYQVLAEGVETEEQIELLKLTKCHLVQGYYYSKPKDVHEIITIIKEKSNIL